MFYGNLFALGSQVTLLSDILRHLSFFFDGIIYSLIPSVFSLIYELYDLSSIFNDTTATKTLINNFTTTIYSFLAIFMFFRVAFSLLGMLVDPSKIDDKDAGASKIVKNILITLALIVVVPIIFDYAKVFQKKVIEEHIIERALYGYNASDEIENLGEVLALNTWKTFVNITDESKASAAVKSAYDDIFNASTTELGGVWPVSKLYFVLNETVGINVLGQVSILGITNGLLQKNFEAGTYYQISYVYILSTIVGFYVLISVIKLMIDVAYRSIKFFALELLSPIAIVSYIDPNSAKKGIFAKWLKQVISTYLSLFVRIFVFALASVILASFNLNSISIGTMKKLIYLLAVVAFIKVAPKFIDDIFGTTISKDSDTKFAFDLLKQGLGFATGAAIGGISNAVVAKRTGQPVFKNAVKGAWSSGNKMSAAAKKTGYDYWSGMIGAGVGAVNDSYKNLGYKVDKDRDRLIEQLESRVDTIDKAKKTASAEMTEDVQKAKAEQGYTINGRKYGKGVEEDDTIKNLLKKNAGGTAKDLELHRGDAEYAMLRNLVSNQKEADIFAQTTLSNAKYDHDTDLSAFTNADDKYVFAADYAKKTASMKIKDLDEDGLKQEFGKQIRRQAAQTLSRFESSDASEKTSIAASLGIDITGMSSEQASNEIEARLATNVNSSVKSYESLSASDKKNTVLNTSINNIDYELQHITEAELSSRFDKLTGERIEVKYGNNIKDMEQDAAKAKGDVDAAQKALDDYLNSGRGKKAKDLDSAYAIADSRHKAKTQADEAAKANENNNNQNNNGGNTN